MDIAVEETSISEGIDENETIDENVNSEEIEEVEDTDETAPSDDIEEVIIEEETEEVYGDNGDQGTPSDVDPETDTAIITFYGNAETEGQMDTIESEIPLEEIIIPECGFTRTGYSFKEWNTESDGTGETFSVGDTIIIPEDLSDVDLYAQWTPNQYTIEFIGNGATDGSMKPMQCEYDSEYTLSARTFKKKGYTFTGWNTKKDGSGDSFSNKEVISNLTNKNNGKVKLYAQWTITDYVIKYVNGHSNKNNPTSYRMNTATFTLKNPTWTGHTFQGWYTDSKLTKKATKINKGSVGDKTFYAKWTTNKYTIKYNGNGSTSGSVKSKTCNYGKTYNIAKNGFARKGYTFTGWNTKKDGSGTKYKANQEITNLRKNDGAVVTLYAQWKAKTYNISYNLKGGKLKTANPDTYKITSVITLKSPTKTGYIFKGWYKNSSYTGAPIYTITKGTVGNLTLYAKWEPIKYTIRFDGNGADSGAMNSITCEYNKAVIIPYAAYNKNNWRFKFWNTKPDGSGINYYPGDSIKNLTTKANTTITLYARWAGDIDISFNSGPFSYYDYDGNILTQMDVYYITWSWQYYPYYDAYNVQIHPECIKLYNAPWERSTEYVKCRYVVRNEYGHVIDSGYLIQNNLRVGDTYIDDIYLTLVPKGDYYIEFYDD